MAISYSCSLGLPMWMVVKLLSFQSFNLNLLWPYIYVAPAHLLSIGFKLDVLTNKSYKVLQFSSGASRSGQNISLEIRFFLVG